MLKTLLLCSFTAALACVPLGCKDSEAPAAEEVSASPEAIVERHDDVSVAWTVTDDGRARAVVLDAGKPSKKEYQGNLTWDGKPVEMKPNATTGVLEAQGPKLDADITQIGYVITGPEKREVRGTLHLPRGGTKELAAKAEDPAAAEVRAEAGPHGGKVQVVGKDRIELVANPDTGELRVYVLDGNGEVVAVGDRKITVAVVSDQPEVVVLTPEPKGQYATGKLAAAADPLKITVAVHRDDSTRVVIVDHAPGEVIVVGSRAPRVKIMVKGTFWAPAVVVIHDDDDDHHHHTKIHIKNKGKGKGKGNSQVKVHIH